MSEETFQPPDLEHLRELLPQYDIESFIAKGGMGAVYKGRQRSLDRDVAVKILPRELGEDAEFRESFITEAKAMARLNHPNLIGVYDFGDVDGLPYIVMEYVHGKSLYHSSWNQAVDPPQALAIVKGICDGLAHAHENGVIHRDIKPANILLTPKAEPKIGDFGLALPVDADGPGLVMGTPGYTAPEVFDNPAQATARADIYSVGVILHQLLTGIDPTNNSGPPSHAVGNIRLDAIWRKAAHPDPSKRYPDVQALGADIDKWLQARTLGSSLATGPVGLKDTSGYRPPPAVTSTKSQGSSIVSKLIVTAILGIAIWFTYQILLVDQRNTIDPAEQDARDEPPDANARKEKKHKGPRNVEPSGDVHFIAPSDPTPARPDPEDLIIDIDPDTPPAPLPVPDVPEERDLRPGDPELRKKAAALVIQAGEDLNKRRAENTRALVFKLEVHERNASPIEERMIQHIKASITDDRLPPAEEFPWLSESLANLYKYAADRQQTLEKAQNSQLTTIRDAYVTRLKTAADDTDDPRQKRRLEAQAEEASDLDHWISILAEDPSGRRRQ